MNRIKITGLWASRSLSQNPKLSFQQRVREYWHHLIFRSALFSLDILFWKAKITRWIRRKLGMTLGLDFEDELERSMRGFAKSNFGMDVAHAAFEG